LDESGDLGFDYEGKKPSEKFVIALLVCNDRKVARVFRKAVRRTIKNKLNPLKKKNQKQELKGTKTSIEVKQYFFRLCPDSGWSIYTITQNKK
jgi:hypothetical protein